MLKNHYHKIVFSLIFAIVMLVTGCTKQASLQPLVPGDTILAFGDSLTYGTGASPVTSYPQDLANMTGFKVINAGVPGEQTSASLNRIKDLLDENNPSLVIVCLGGNDLLHKQPLAQIKANLKTIIQIIQQRGAQVALIAVPEPVWTLQVPHLYQELGEELNVPVETKTIRTLMREPEYKSDYVHFNAAGYQILAENIKTFLHKHGAL